MADSESPRIYVACLAAYNAGRLYGQWIDANQSPNDLADAVRAMLARSPVRNAQEFAIHDYEGFGGAKVDEHASLQSVADLAAFIVDYGDAAVAALVHFAGLDEAREAVTERYHGSAASLAEWAEAFLEETGQLASVPEALRSYIDFERYAADLELGGDVVSVDHNGTVHVFAGA